MNTTTQLTLPPVGTVIAVSDQDFGLSNDGRTYMSRITLQDGRWVVASRLDQTTMRWVPTTEDGSPGLMVFLSNLPEIVHTKMTISGITNKGRAVYADLS